MRDLIRCFIAIEIPAEIQTALACTMTQAQINRRSGFKPVRPESIHLTLKFLGELAQEKLPSITAGLDELCKKVKSFTFQVGGLGAFPSWDCPRTIWVGLEDSSALEGLFQLVGELTTSTGFPDLGSKFSPHLTLARVSKQRDAVIFRQKTQTLRSFSKTEFGKVHATHLTFFKSILLPGGSVYQPLSVHPFAGKRCDRIFEYNN